MKILMLFIYLDDEILFVYNDIYHNNIDVICFTSKSNNVRANEFNECCALSNINGHMLDLLDSATDTWKEFTNKYIIDNIIKPLLTENYTMIVSHNEKGEYGNLQHKRVNSIASDLSKELKIPFMTFYSRFDINDYKNKDFVNKRDTLLDVYKSQIEAVNVFRNSFYIKDKYKKFLCYRNI